MHSSNINVSAMSQSLKMVQMKEASEFKWDSGWLSGYKLLTKAKMYGTSTPFQMATKHHEGIMQIDGSPWTKTRFQKIHPTCVPPRKTRLERMSMAVEKAKRRAAQRLRMATERLRSWRTAQYEFTTHFSLYTRLHMYQPTSVHILFQCSVVFTCIKQWS